MKKAVVLLLLLLLVLSGCSKTQPPSLNDDNAATTQADVERYGFENGNLSAGGLMCGDGHGWVYYRSEADHWCLYKAKLDGTEKTKLCADKSQYINVLDEWVYYCNFDDEFSIYRIQTNGNNRQKLIDGYCGNLHVTSEKLYFDMRNENNSPQIYSADLDGGNRNLLAADLSVAAYYDGTLYGRDTTNLYAVDPVTGTMETIFAGYTYNVSADNSGIYFWAVDEGRYYRLDYGGSKTVLNSGGDFFTYADRKLYYWGYGGKNHDFYCIYCLNTESGQVEPVLSLSPQYFDKNGNDIGITIRELRDGLVTPDGSLLDPLDGALNAFCENANYTYVIDENMYNRGVLRESVLQTGKADCWILCDGEGGIAWD